VSGAPKESNGPHQCLSVALEKDPPDVDGFSLCPDGNDAVRL
jgi:hypothetical protein